MAPKRALDSKDAQVVQKKRKGFSVGPANLPDGTYKRKVQKIKGELIERAKTKQAYAKVRERVLKAHQPTQYADDGGTHQEPVPEANASIHPERKAILERGGRTSYEARNSSSMTMSESGKTEAHEAEDSALVKPSERSAASSTTKSEAKDRVRWTKREPFAREMLEAQRQAVENQARREAAQRGQAERQQRLMEREQQRRAMAKARSGGRNGQRKLGRESVVLLQRVQRMLANGQGGGEHDGG